MRTPKYSVRVGLVAVVIAIVAVLVAPAREVSAQVGNFSAQIQLAIRRLLAGNQTITGDWTCTGTCTGFGGGGGVPAGWTWNSGALQGGDGAAGEVALNANGLISSQILNESGVANFNACNTTWDGCSSFTTYDDGSLHINVRNFAFQGNNLQTDAHSFNVIGAPINLAPADSFDTPGNWDVGANWTLGAGAVHTPGDTAALSNTSMNPIISGQAYWIKLSSSGGSAGSVTVFLGGTEVFTVTSGSHVTGFMTRATTTDPLTFVPTSDYDGELDTIVMTLATPIATFTPNSTTSLLFPDPFKVNQLGGLQIGNDSAAAAFGYVPTSSQILVGGTLVGDIWPEIAISGLTTQGAILSLNSNASQTHLYQWPTGTNAGVFQLDVNTVGGFSIDPSTGAISILGTPKLAALTGAGNLPACLAADGTVFAGSNTAGVLSCP